MTKLLKFALGVDKASAQFGHLAAFAVLAAALISAGNAFIRYGFDISSNGWLEIQWYLFAATVMLGAPLVLKLNEHVRVDIFYGQLKGNAPVYIDLLGLVVFLLLFVVSWKIVFCLAYWKSFAVVSKSFFAMATQLLWVLLFVFVMAAAFAIYGHVLVGSQVSCSCC